jgi:hypothetical protein
MATTVKLRQCDDVEQARREGRESLIGKRVILDLGEPSDLVRVQVRELWERRYRVNIYVGPDAISARVANSYFLETDDDGHIMASAPRIKRLYGVAAQPPTSILTTEAVTSR